MTNEFIKIDNLQIKLGQFTLGPISFTLNKGDYLVLLGPTGCGKTSLMKCIAGYNRKAKGNIIVDKTSMNKLYPAKRKVAYITQTSDLFPHLTVSENVEFGLSYLKLTKSEKKEKLNRYIKLFDLEHIKNSPAYTLSGGESKRCAMARGLIIEPNLLLLDEPLGMLDHNGRVKMLETLKMIHAELGTTTIHVTHDRHEAWGISKNCAVMDQGKLLQTGTVDELFRKPDNIFTAQFLGCSNIFNAEVTNDKIKLPWTEIAVTNKNKVGGYNLILRPEHLEICETSKGRINGTVKSLNDFGEFFEIGIRVENELLTVHSTKRIANNLNVNEQVGVNWSDSDLHIF